ncbi:MAG: hypothetical protein ACMXYG_04690 [Candidatus Woesearchaeota archaeon]
MKKLTIIIFALLTLIASLTMVNAEFWACFDQGQTVNFCNPLTPDRICSNSGGCIYCMHSYDEVNDCYNQGNWLICNNQPMVCTPGSGGSSIDSDPPELTINSPIDGEIYNTRRLLVDIETDELTNIRYIDNLNNRGRWSSLCTRCTTYSREINFNEGLNNITISAVDLAGNENSTIVTFIIDTQAPRITSVEPTRGFASGEFTVQFQEDNPVSLILHYGTAQNMRQASANLESCLTERGRTTCTLNVNLNDYDQQEIQYWWVITDIAESTDTSNTQNIMVDNTPPVITSLDYTLDGRFVHFDIEIDELNFQEVLYYNNNDLRPRWNRLCNRLVDGRCQARASFRDGLHELDIQVNDQAGNSVGESISFFTDSRKPRITTAEPRRGFASGEFKIDFIEENPIEVTLYYGNEIIGNRQTDIPLETCVPSRNGLECEIYVDLDNYDGTSIEYYFEVIDIVGQYDTSRPVTLEVDTTYPVINSLEYTVDRRRVAFAIDITEDNFEEVIYINHADLRPRWNRLCSRLNADGVCERILTFREGTQNLDIQVVDQAGNSVGQSISFTTTS